MFVNLFVLIALATSTFAGEINFDECSNSIPVPKTVRVSACEADGCTVIRGKDLSFEADFASPVDATDLKLSVDARLFGAWSPWNKAPKDICGKSVECPLKKGSNYTYKFTTTILPEYPATKTRVRYSLKSNTDEDIFCFTFPVRIV